MISNETMAEIANMDFSDYKDPSEKFQEVMAAFDEYFKYTDIIDKVVPAYQNIKEYGVTDSIYNTYNDLLWNNVQFDLTPFVNCSTEQLMYGIEGLGAVIRKIYEILRNIIWKIKDFFTSDGFLAKWFNPCQKTYDQVIKVRDLCLKHGGSFDANKFSQTAVTTFEFNEFRKRNNVLNLFSNKLYVGMSTIDNIKLATVQGMVNDRDADKVLHIKMGANGNSVTLEQTNLVRTDKVTNLRWKSDEFLRECGMVEGILKRGIVIKSRITMIERALTMSERNISDVLTGHKEPQVQRDNDTIKALNLYMSVLNVVFDLIRGSGNHWCHVGRAYLGACSSYKPGLFS